MKYIQRVGHELPARSVVVLTDGLKYIYYPPVNRIPATGRFFNIEGVNDKRLALRAPDLGDRPLRFGMRQWWPR